MEKQPEYISLNIMKQSYQDWLQYILRKKRGIIAIVTCFLALFIAYSLISSPKYTANLSFVMQGEESGGGFADLASQFGISLGGGSIGAFGGDNLFELLESQMMIERALLKPDTINGKPINLLNLYIAVYQMDKMWKKSENPQLQNLSFPFSLERNSFSRTQDSVFQKVCGMISLKQLTVKKRNKKLSFGDISFTSANEILSKLFVENLMSEAGNYYTQIKSKRSRENYERLNREVDSIRSAYATAINSRALAADNSPNPLRQSASVNVIEKTTEMQYLAATYAEMKKNLELAKVAMDNNTPLIDVIDSPRYPLIMTRFGLLKATVAGLLAGAFSAFLLYTLLFIRQTRKEALPSDSEVL